MGACCDFAGTVAKTILITFNTILLILAVGIIGLGFFGRSQISDIDDVTAADSVGTALWVIIIIGLFFAILALFGCFGSINDNKCLLGSYSVVLILFLIIIGILTTVAFSLPKYDEVQNLNKDFHDKFTNYTTYHSFVDSLQDKLKCCGYDSVNDYNSQYPNGGLPKSCCENMQSGEICNRESNYHKATCHDAVSDVYTTVVTTLKTSTLIVTIVLAVGIVLSCLLICSQ